VRWLETAQDRGQKLRFNPICPCNASSASDGLHLSDKLGATFRLAGVFYQTYKDSIRLSADPKNMIASPDLHLVQTLATPAMDQGAEESQRFAQRVDGLVNHYAAVWEAAEETTPVFGSAIAVADKLKHETQADRQLEEIKKRLRRFPAGGREQGGWRKKLLRAARIMAQSGLGLPAAGLQLFLIEPPSRPRAVLFAKRGFSMGQSMTKVFFKLYETSGWFIASNCCWKNQ
jgi:hypothetical protein